MDFIIDLLRRNLIIFGLFILFLVLLFAFRFLLFIALSLHFFDLLLVFFYRLLLLFQFFSFDFLLLGNLLFCAVFNFAEIGIQLNIGVFLDIILIVLEVGQTLRICAGMDDNGVPINIHEVWQLVENLGHNLHLKHSLISASRTLWHSVPVLPIHLGHPERLNKIIISELCWGEVSEDLVLVLAHYIVEEFVGFGHLGILVLQEV